jgi:YfiH family protein
MEKIMSTLLSKQAGIQHAFFTRNGGVSAGEFESLNVSFASGDDVELVRKNRAIALEEFGLTAEARVSCFQIHSSKVIVAEGTCGDLDPRADGMVTSVPGLALSIFSADCLPILFADCEARIIGAAHAGWRGAIDGIIENTVETMLGLGARKNRLKAAIGPGIQAASYEVGADVRDTYIGKDIGNASFFEPNPNGNFQFDLPRYSSTVLGRLGIEHSLETCDTYRDEQRFFSSRRSAHRGSKIFGRMLSAITLVAT